MNNIWNIILKLDLYFFIFVGFMNCVIDPLKKMQLHFNAQNALFKLILRVCLNTIYYWKLKILFITENWKYCNKIIFKYVNSTVKYSFKVKFVFFPSCESHEQYPWAYRNETQAHWMAQNMLSKLTLSVRLDWNEKLKLFHCSVYFCYYSWVLLHFLALFISPIVLFQLTFTVLLAMIFQF